MTTSLEVGVMDTAGSSTQAIPIPAPGVRDLLRGGRRALKTVPGLRRLLFQGFLLTYLISFVLAVALVVLAYYAFVEPALLQIENWGTDHDTMKGAVAVVLKVFLWAGLVIAVLAAQVVAFLLTLSMMGLWFEALVERVVKHRRGADAAGGEAQSLLGWLKSVGASLAASVWLVFLALFALLVGVVPVVGPLLAFVLNSYLMGREVRDPYLSVRAALGDRARDLIKGRFGWTVRVGVVPVLLAMIPVAGWLVLPVVMVYLTVGLAWAGEEEFARRSRQAADEPAG